MVLLDFVNLHLSRYLSRSRHPLLLPLRVLPWTLQNNTGNIRSSNSRHKQALPLAPTQGQCIVALVCAPFLLMPIVKGMHCSNHVWNNMYIYCTINNEGDCWTKAIMSLNIPVFTLNNITNLTYSITRNMLNMLETIYLTFGNASQSRAIFTPTYCNGFLTLYLLPRRPLSWYLLYTTLNRRYHVPCWIPGPHTI